MARTATGIDVGCRTAELMRGYWKGNTFHVTAFALSRQAAENPTDGWSGVAPAFKPVAARIGLTGRDVNIRYTQVPRVPDWQLRKLMRFEVEEIGDQSGAEVASDFNLLPTLPEIEGEDVVLLAMARESLLTSHMQGLSAVGGKLDAFTPNSLALYAAWSRFGAIQEETVLIANIGCENLDVVLVRGPDLLFARNLTGGSKLFDDAIAERFGISTIKAEEIKEGMATLEPGARYADTNQEKASRAILGAAGQLLSLLQSTVMFCKSQVKLSGLRVDRVLICGGGARLAGLVSYLSQGMGVPVELFDPFRVVETKALDAQSVDLLEQSRLESVVALGLATMASDPEAYSVEILPAKARRAREFWGGTAFLIAAGVLGILFLGLNAWTKSQRLSEVSGQVKSLEARVRKATSTDRKARELMQRSGELETLAGDVFALRGSGEQVARVLFVLEQRMPAEFWITELESSWSVDEELGVLRGEERPVLHLEGRAREGTESSSALFSGFIAALEQELPGVRIKPRPSPGGDSFSIDLTLLGPIEETAEGEDTEEEGA